jgi:DNA polymerase-1
MSSPSGLPTNALFGFTRDMIYLRTERRPDYLVCAFDTPGPTFRDELYADYKAHRPPAPDDLNVQIPLIVQMLEAMRIPVLGIPGFEADDVLATVARASGERGLEVLICTSDKDCRQLITDRVQLLNLRKQQIFDREALLKEWCIKPEQVIDFQALVGDSVDNVPGVPGIGVKTAAKLLQEFGSLDNLLANLDRVTPARIQEKLRTTQEQARLSQRLVRLSTDVPVSWDWDGWRLRDWDAPKLLELFQTWGFRSFGNQVRAAVGSKESDVATTAPPVQGELFPFGANVASETEGATDESLPTAHCPPPTDSWQATYQLVNSPAQFQEFLKQLRKQKRIAIDLETTSLEPRRAEPVGLAFCWQPGEAWYLAVHAPQGEATLDPARTLAALRPVLEDERVAKVNQNIKYDLQVLRQHGVALAGVVGDPMVADYLLHAGERSHNMDALANRYLNHQVITITDLIGKKGKNQLRIDEVPSARVAEYSGEDADVAWRLCEYLEPQLATRGLAKLYTDVEVPLIDVLAELEFNGIRIDLPFLERLSQEMARQLETIEHTIYDLAGHPFNIASPKQLRQVLFDELKLPTQRRTGITGEASTDQETLDRLAALGHPLPRMILEHRQIAKLKGTYVDALPSMVNPSTGRIHASFNQTVAATGRLSSSDPNLQNIPVRTEQGRQIRQAFLPEEGWLLLTADYSQVELRLLAHFCEDAELRRAFAEDQDIHASVAAQVFGVRPADVTSEMRRRAKTVNFGVIYGISAHGLATRLGISREEGARFIDAYFARYPKVQQYQARLLEQCRRNGYVSTILGRRREFDTSAIRPGSSYQSRNQTEREAINMEIQGSAADLLKLAMVNIHRRLRREKHQTRMLLTVHDELVFEVPPEELDAVTEMVNHEMTTALTLEVPLKVDLAVGPNWLDVETIFHEGHEEIRSQTAQSIVEVSR